MLRPIPSVRRAVAVLGLLAVGFVSKAAASDLQILLPLGRTACQTNEWIDLSVIRKAPQALPAGNLLLSVVGDDGSKVSSTFTLPAVPLQGAEARATEHLHLNGRLLRPGHYTVEVDADGATVKATFDLFSHVRKTSFRLVNWGRAQGKDQLAEGEDNLGFNLFYGHYGSDDEANFIRAGMDFMACCTMSGGHQMDLRPECDWSDPYVTRGGTQRVVRRAFIDRTRPNVVGVHFYDEPGLTWWKNTKTGQWTPHGIPSQVRSYKSAFGNEPIAYNEVNPSDPEQAARWRHWAWWKLGFMDAAWREAQWGVSWVRPDYISATQTQYGFSAFTDGIYFNAARCLPITSGHGGYDDFGGGYFNPSYFLEIARARDFGKPCWYLPTWYGNTPSDRFRLEQYLCFITGLQGMISPPDIDPFQPATKPAAEGVVETNKLMARLGTIFTTMPVTRPPVAMLYSMSHNIHVQTRDRSANYAHENDQGVRLPLVYLAGKLLQHQFLTVVEEDVVDGTLAAHHKAVVITSVEYLDPKVIAALEAFAAKGGLVLLTADCKVKIRGATDLGVTPDLPDAAIVRGLVKERKYAEAAKYSTLTKQLEGAAPVARAIKTHLGRAGIKPVLQSDQPGIVATRQAAGDIEYLFAVNATHDPQVGGLHGAKPVEAVLGIANDGRPVYDAVLGGPAAGFRPQGNVLAGKFRFGVGQLRAFARTVRPIGKVQAITPIVRCDFTKEDQPLAVEIAAVLADQTGRVLCGSAPLELRLVDPLGNVRYHLYRATEQGTFRMALPLATNDPPGQWTVVVRDLLGNTTDAASFALPGVSQCGAIAGATPRAVSFGNDRDNAFRFFRMHHDVKLVLGSSDFNQPAAQRLAESLKPWGMRCEMVKAADVNRPRELTAEEVVTWVGLEFGRVKPGKDNPVGHVGFDIRGPVILLGNAEDNPLIQYVQKQRFFPYAPDKEKFPGAGRGMFAWQRDAVGIGQESLTLIAYDAVGMAEAAGSLYEAAAGLEPLTRWTPPVTNSLVPASKSSATRELTIAWQAALPDRATAMKADAGHVDVLTWDGSLVRLNASGKVVSQQTVQPGEIPTLAKSMTAPPDAAAMALAQKHAPVGRIVKTAVAHNRITAVAYWGGTLQTLAADGQVQTQQLLPQDITGLVWRDGRLVVGLADGRVMGMK